MNYSQALKGCLSNSGKQQAIHSAAETELGRKLTKQELTSLSTKFSLDELYGNLQKVNILGILKLNLSNMFSVWLWLSPIPENAD